MPVSAAERDYLLAQVDRLAQTDLNNLWRQAESLSNVDFFGYVSAAFPEVVDVYHQTAGQLAATWFEESNPASSYVAQVVEPLARQQLVSSVQWALGADGEQAVSRMSGTMQRAVYGGARDTVVLNAEVTGSRWLRVARPNACEFCRMLATRTGNYAYTSKAAAEGVVGMKARNRRKGARKLGEKYHDHCHCQAVEIRDTQTVDDVLNDEQRKLFRQWNDEYDKARANAGTTETKKLLAVWRQQNSAIVVAPDQQQPTDIFAGLLPRKDANESILESKLVQRTGQPESVVIREANTSNPSWVDPAKQTKDSNKRYGDNCTHCVNAYELRRRGYDVEATPAPRAGGRSMEREILPRWVDKDGKTPTMTTAIYNTREKMDEVVQSWGPGARGWITVAWKDGGAHIFAVENVGGKVVYLEPQHPMLGNGTAESHFGRVRNTLGAVRYIRVDDLVPTTKIVDATDPLVRSVADGKIERAKVQARAEKRRAKQEEINKRKPQWDLVFKAAEDANHERAAFTFGVNDALTKTAKQLVANENKQLTKSQREAYRAGVEWYRQWLAAR